MGEEAVSPSRWLFAVALFLVARGASADLPTRPSCATDADGAAVRLPTLENTRDVSRPNLRAWVSALAAPELSGRKPGTPGGRLAAEMIAGHFAAMGARAPGPSGYCMGFDHDGIHDENVVAHLAPARPTDGGAACWVVLGAHYDALGIDDRGRLRPGADDNASGVAVVMEALRLASAGAHPLSVGLVVAAFSSEEAGLIGSGAYVSTPTVTWNVVSAMVNVDMVGRRIEGNPGVGYDVRGQERPRTRSWLRQSAAAARVSVAPMNFSDRGDSGSFSPHVPTVFLSTAIDTDAHRPIDTPDKVDYEQVERAARLVVAFLERATCGGEGRQ
jgi:aminopeptidase N